MYESANGKANNVSAQNQLVWSVKLTECEGAALKVLFVGNSITRHAPKPSIGWAGDWGMAASGLDKDYVHLVVAGLIERFGKISYGIAQAATWETQYWNGKAILEEKYQEAQDFGADLVIIRIGENMNHEKEREVNCKPYFDETIREIAGERGYHFCKISDLEQDERTMPLGQFECEGVARHPSDFGMKCIADRILAAVDQEECCSSKEEQE